MNAGFKTWLWSGLVGAVLLVPAGACAEEMAPPPPAPAAESTAPAPAAESTAPAPAAESTAPAPAAEGTAPAPAASDAEKLLEQQAASDEKVRQEVAAQSAAQLETGKRLFAAFDYEAARHELELAVQLDRNNDEAAKLLMRVNDILGVRKDRIRSAVAQLLGEAKIRAQEGLLELDNRIDLAKRFIQDAQTSTSLTLPERIRKYEQALATLERARELIKWMPVEIRVDEQTNEVNRLTNETRSAIKSVQARLVEVDRREAERVAIEQREALRQLEQRKLNTMIDQAKALQETGKYEAAIELANRILELDPSNPEAHTIIAVSRDRFFTRKDQYIKEEYKEQFTVNRERAERMNIPHHDYIIYPANWREIAQRTGQETQRRPEEPWKEEIRKKMARRVTFEFVDTPLTEALTFLNSLTKVNLVLDPKVAQEGADKTPITLRVNDMELELALRWILRLADLEYDLRMQAVFITRKANLASNVEMAVYDIRDLTATVTDFPGPRIDIGAQENAVANPFEQATAKPTLQTADLQSLIRERLLPNEFTDEATSIEESGGQLIVMQRPEVHEKIRQLLRSFRETQAVEVLTQVRFIDVTDGFLEKIGVSFTGLDSAPGEAGLPNAAVIPNAQPSPYGLYPAGGGPGSSQILSTSDVQPSPAFQFSQFIPTPPYHQDFGGTASQPGPAPITILRPRLDPNFPAINRATNNGPALQAAGFRRQWWEQVFGSPVLVQGLTQNLTRLNPLNTMLGSSLVAAPQQGALFQFRFLQSVQANAVLQAVRKDQTADQLLAPKLMQFNNQRSHILVVTQRSYIKDYDVSGAVYDPVISSYLTGVVLDCRPTVSNDKRYITMEMRPGTASEVAPPDIVTIVGTLLPPMSLPIELPNIELRSISTTVTIPDNGTILFSGLTTDRKMDAKSGVPVLSDLPIIGRLFSTNHKERERRNLLVLLNSRVVLFDEEEARL